MFKCKFRDKSYALNVVHIYKSQNEKARPDLILKSKRIWDIISEQENIHVDIIARIRISEAIKNFKRESINKVIVSLINYEQEKINKIIQDNDATK